MQLLLQILILIVSFYMLAIICDEFFVESLEKISKRLKLSSEITGATFMAIWTSAPELFTSIFTVFAIFGSASWNESIGAWTIVWSAIFNIMVIIWASAIVMNKSKSKSKDKNKISRQPVIRDLSFYIITIAALFLIFFDWKIILVESIILIVLYIIYLFLVKNRWKRLHYSQIEESINEIQEEKRKKLVNRMVIKVLSLFIPNPEKWKNRFWVTFAISIILIALFSHFMVESAVEVANILNIPKAIVWLTILAAWTSIPDLLSSIIVAKKWKWDMSIANAIGSNIFDILIGLWLVYFMYLIINPEIKSIPVDKHNLSSSVILLFWTAIVLLFFLISQKWRIKKYAWYTFIWLYLAYVIYNVFLIL